MNKRQPLAGEGQVTINTPMWNVPHGHPRKIKHHTERLRKMNKKIYDCLDRCCTNSPMGTRIKVDDETWLIRDTGLTI